MLATSQTDRQVELPLSQCMQTNSVRCWASLGVAVRTAQAIGLHTETSASGPIQHVDESVRERRRCTWYSIYVLDRLLSLQLGRPPAIVDTFYNVPLPIPPEDYKASSYGFDDGYEQDKTDGVEDYFTAMIKFSHLIGDVLQQLYGPHKTQLLHKTMHIIEECDHKLLRWRASLPRRLRFDLGHTFDSSIMFKRQVCSFSSISTLANFLNRETCSLSSSTTYAR